jgi:hypothetical protein
VASRALVLAGAENTIPSLRGVELPNILGRINVPSGEDLGIKLR